MRNSENDQKPSTIHEKNKRGVNKFFNSSKDIFNLETKIA
jgi:hypothetical protein